MIVLFDPLDAIETNASDDITRASIRGVHVDAAKLLLVATNGHSLSVVPCTIEGDARSVTLPPECVALARKAARKTKHTQARIEIGDKTATVTEPTGAITPFPLILDPFPSYEMIVPPQRDGHPNTFSVALNPELLINACRALGIGAKGKSSFVTLVFNCDAGSANDPIYVSTDEKAYAVVMPARGGHGYVSPEKDPVNSRRDES